MEKRQRGDIPTYIIDELLILSQKSPYKDGRLPKYNVVNSVVQGLHLKMKAFLKSYPAPPQIKVQMQCAGNEAFHMIIKM